MPLKNIKNIIIIRVSLCSSIYAAPCILETVYAIEFQQIISIIICCIKLYPASLNGRISTSLNYYISGVELCFIITTPF